MLIKYDMKISIEDSKKMELPEDTSVASRIIAIFPVSRGSVSIRLINLFETKNGKRKQVAIEDTNRISEYQMAVKRMMALSKNPEPSKIKKVGRKKPSTNIRSLHKKE